jgi:hypothetical protein
MRSADAHRNLHLTFLLHPDEPDALRIEGHRESFAQTEVRSRTTGAGGHRSVGTVLTYQTVLEPPPCDKSPRHALPRSGRGCSRSRESSGRVLPSVQRPHVDDARA